MKRCDPGLKYLKSNINSFKLGKILSINYYSFDGSHMIQKLSILNIILK